MSLVETKLPSNISKIGLRFLLRHIDNHNLNTVTGGSAMSSVTEFATRWQLLQVFIHFSAANSLTVTLTWKSKDATTYDTQIVARTLNAETSFYYEGNENHIFESGDELEVAITSAAGAPHAYLTITGWELP